MAGPAPAATDYAFSIVAAVYFPMYDDLLIATDGSDLASRAATQGIAIAAAVDARVHAVSVADAREGSPGAERERERCHRFVDAVVAEALDHDVPADAIVRDGRPHGEILAAADERDVDLLVLGTHGRTGLRRWLLGSVAIGVIRAARRPVLTVGRSVATVPRDLDRILVATDGRQQGDAPVREAIALAETFEATLHALSVVDDVHSRLPVVLEAFEKAAEETTTDVERRAIERGVDVVTDIERGVPHDVIVEYASDRDVDLLVLGTESRSGLDRLAMGSVSQRVVGSAPAPVLTVRPTE